MDSEVEAEIEVIQKLASAMHRWYWSRKGNIDRHDAVKPALDVLEYVYKARKEGLDKRSETAYCGSLLLYSVLTLTGRRHTSDVEEANELYEAGRNLASVVWDELDRVKKGAKDPDGLDSAYTELIGRISDALWREYQKIKMGKVEKEVEKGKNGGIK